MTGITPFARTIAMALSTSACDPPRFPPFAGCSSRANSSRSWSSFWFIVTSAESWTRSVGFPMTCDHTSVSTGRVDPTSPEVRAQPGLIVDVAASDAHQRAHLDGRLFGVPLRLPEPGVRGVPLGCGGGGLLIGGSWAYPT